MTSLTDAFDQTVRQRRSIRFFKQSKHFDSNIVTRSLERAILAPNSSNMQLWEFYRIQSKQAKKDMARICLGQKAAQTAQEIVVFVCPKQKWKLRQQFNLDMFQNIKMSPVEKKIYHYYKQLIPKLYRNDSFGIIGLCRKLYMTLKGIKNPVYREVSYSDLRIVAHKSCALAAQTFMLSLTAEGYGSCPMEGYDSLRLKKLLQLPSKTEINMAIAVGIPDDTIPPGPQRRLPLKKISHLI